MTEGTATSPRRTHPPAASVGELIAGASAVERLDNGDGKSGAALDRVEIDGVAHVLKHVGGEADWLARAAGDRRCLPVTVWEAGLLDRLPDCIEHPVVGSVREGADRGALLMRDVSEHLVAEGDTPLPFEEHRRFLRHMAAMHAGFWGFHDDLGLLPMRERCTLLSPRTADREIARGGDHPVPTRLLPAGWVRLVERRPGLQAVVAPLLADPTPLLEGLAATPTTLLHGDWKAGNLGSRSRRTILLDWALPGAGPGCVDLTHYLALNARRLPEPREAAVEAYRVALQQLGIDTRGWWDRQLALSVLVTVLMFGWEKALGDDDELRWWHHRAVAAARWL